MHTYRTAGNFRRLKLLKIKPFEFIFKKICRVNPVIFTTEYQPLDLYLSEISEFSKFPEIIPFKNFPLYSSITCLHAYLG